MIHNRNKVVEGMRIEYLKLCVKEDAAKIINHKEPTTENYTTCYNNLLNKRLILGKLIR